ncbi:MAG TPA: baseplate J/gp47 family protein [Solirubrobacteraceae bacterium]|nr:baseplate J/gp47 family protein [Solirubrobacteraceae bacterium]
MPFARPTLPELRDRIRRDFNARLPGADALLRQSNLSVIADVLAGLSTLHYGYQEWLSRQLFPDTAETAFLERWASIWGLARRPATAAVGAIAVTGTPGAVVPAGAEFQRLDRIRYRALDGATLEVDGTASVAVEATTAGSITDALAGTTVTTVTALAGVVAQATIAAPGMAGGADLETDAQLRTRLLARIQTPPMGGAASDYVDWTLEVPGVTRVWVAPQEQGPGTVVVRFAMDDPAHPNGIPTAADVALVQAHLDEVRPVTAQVIVVAPIPHPIDITIATLTPDTPAVRTAVLAELTDTLFRHGVPGATLFVSWLWEAVSLASGERHHRILVPPGDVALGAGELPILGTVTYVD